jgi:hypothetical protein
MGGERITKEISEERRASGPHSQISFLQSTDRRCNPSLPCREGHRFILLSSFPWWKRKEERPTD